MKTVLVTGAAGFVGFHCTQALLAAGWRVVGLDNFNPYYDPALKEARAAVLGRDTNFSLHRMDLGHREGVMALFGRERPSHVLHLAAQAGVRHSLENPHSYTASNVEGTLAVLEACRHHPVEHLVYASSSSVYGANTQTPFRETDRVDDPVSLYAATKRAGELMARTYAHLYAIPATGLRFFTVYGRYGRPDMAYWSFTQRVLAGETIDLFNAGRLRRDFTHVSDIVTAIRRLLELPPGSGGEGEGDEGPPHRILNIGNNQPVELARFVAAIGAATGLPVRTRDLPMQPGDVFETYADVSALAALTGFRPDTTIEAGMADFVAWFRDYHGIPAPAAAPPATPAASEPAPAAPQPALAS